MASTSSRTYIFEGVKISIKLLQDISNGLPAPASIVVGLVAGVITSIDTLKRNREQCDLLRDRLVRLLPVVMAAINDIARGKTDRASSLDELRRNVEQFRKNLEAISEEVGKMAVRIKSKRMRRKVVAAIFGESQSSVLQKCSDDLDWAIKEFEVTTHLADAVHRCEALDKIRSILSHQILHSLPPAKYATFESERADKPTNCFEGTRTGVLNEIRDWIHSQDAKRIFWLSGIAGVGKTTVMRTAAQQARSDGTLGAQFFFSRRGEADLRDPRVVFPTIAYQLARFDPDFGERIIVALDAEPDAAFGSLKDQLDKIIVEPLSHVERDPNRVVVIVLDAFDECEADGAKQILQLLIDAIPRLPFYLKILLASRPEHHIHSVLLPSNNLRIAALHDIEASIVADDILRYLRYQLRNLPKRRGLDVPEDWITDDEIEIIADKAGNLFIHAATSLRFLEDAINIREQLDILLKILRTSRRSSKGDQPFVDLDNLYLEILRGSLTPRNKAEVGRLFQPVLGSIVLLRDALPVDALERLTGLDTISDILPLLSSVILRPVPPENCPRIYHPSFPDFLQDETRCTDERFWIDSKKHEALMALRCLTLLDTKLRKGMLSDPDPTLLNSEVVDLEGKVRTAFSPELQYACRYWAAHFLAAANGEGGLELGESLDSFAAKSLLPWVEAMSWLGDVRLCLASLRAINSWAANSSCLPLTKGLLNDAHRMLLAHFTTVNLGAQHVARSIFPFLPHNIRLMSQYPEYIDPVITVLSGVGPDWPACLTVLKSHSGTVRSVSFSPDSSQLASASDDKTIHVCDAIGGGSLVVLRGHSDRVFNIAFSPDASRLASASADGTIRVWDPISGGGITMLEGHSSGVRSLSFSPDGSRLASGSADRIIRIWDPSTSRCLVKLQDPSGWVCSVTFSPDGLRLASGSYDRTIRVWDAITADCLTTLRGHSDVLSAVAFFPDGLQLASASDDKTVRLWNIATGSCLAILEGHSDKVYSIAISLDGTRRLASGSLDGTIRVWDTTSHACLTTLTGHYSAVHSISFSTDGSRLVSGSGDASVRIWDTSNTSSPASVQGHSKIVKSMTFSPDGHRIASASDDNTVQLWDAVTGGMLATLKGHTDWVETVAFSPDGLHLASGSKDTTARLWDGATQDCLTIYRGHSRSVRSVAFCPNYDKLASGSHDNTIRIWGTVTMECLAVLRGHSDFVLDVAFSPDGAHLASGSYDGTVKVWDAVAETCSMTLNGHASPLASIMFSSGGSEIISRSEDGDVRVWDTGTGAEVDTKTYQARTRTGRQLEFEGGRLSQIDILGSKHLLCIVPASYVVDPKYLTTRTAFLELGPGRARVALGCEDGAVLIFEVVLD